LSAARLTHGWAGSAVTTAPSGIFWEGLRTGSPFTRTSPAAMASWAFARVSNTPVSIR
jgi:hypothetical protein